MIPLAAGDDAPSFPDHALIPKPCKICAVECGFKYWQEPAVGGQGDLEEGDKMPVLIYSTNMILIKGNILLLFFL